MFKLNHVSPVIIKAPVEKVYAFMTDPQNRLKYSPGLVAVSHTPEGPLQIGSKITEVNEVMGRQGEMITEVTDLEPGRKVGYRTLPDDPMNASGYYEFEAIPEGTRLTLHFNMAPRGMMKLVVPLMAGKLRRDTENAFQNLKKILEDNGD